MSVRLIRRFRPVLDNRLEDRAMPSHASVAVGAAHIVAGPIAARPAVPTLSMSTYRLVMSDIDSAFATYRGQGAVNALGSALDGLLQTINGLTSPDSPPDSSSGTGSGGDKGNNSMLMQQVSDAILHLPYGATLWTSIPIDPSSITTANSLATRDEIKMMVRRFVRDNIQQGTVVWQNRSSLQATKLHRPRGPLGPVHVASSPPIAETPFRA